MLFSLFLALYRDKFFFLSQQLCDQAAAARWKQAGFLSFNCARESSTSKSPPPNAHFRQSGSSGRSSSSSFLFYLRVPFLLRSPLVYHSLLTAVSVVFVLCTPLPPNTQRSGYCGVIERGGEGAERCLIQLKGKK